MPLSQAPTQVLAEPLYVSLPEKVLPDSWWQTSTKRRQPLCERNWSRLPQPKPFRCIALRVDVRLELSIKAMVEMVVEGFGRIDYAVNYTGIGLKRALGDTTMEEWDHMMSINLTGVFVTLKADMAAMMKQQPLVVDE